MFSQELYNQFTPSYEVTYHTKSDDEESDYQYKVDLLQIFRITTTDGMSDDQSFKRMSDTLELLFKECKSALENSGVSGRAEASKITLLCLRSAERLFTNDIIMGLQMLFSYDTMMLIYKWVSLLSEDVKENSEERISILRDIESKI